MAKLRKEYNPDKASRRKRRPITYIICEGKETETLYFRNFRSRNCLVDIVPDVEEILIEKYNACEPKPLLHPIDTS